MESLTFESKILSDGHLYCPKKYAKKKNVKFKVTVTFDNIIDEASDQNIELSSTIDVSGETLSKDEINYYTKK